MEAKIINYKEYCESLKTISYEKIVDILKNEKDCCYLAFKYCDDLMTLTRYTIVIMRNFTNGVYDEYLSPDQNDDDIYDNLMKIIDENIDNPQFNTFDDNSEFVLTCSSGNSTLCFPKGITKKFIKMKKNKTH